MKRQIVLKKIKIRNFSPLTARDDRIERKKILRDKLKAAIGKDLSKFKKNVLNDPKFSIDVCFYLLESDKHGKPKKDLDNLLKILFDVLSENMVSRGQKPINGLGIMKDDSYIYKIKCEKKIVTSEVQEGFDLKISNSA